LGTPLPSSSSSAWTYRVASTCASAASGDSKADHLNHLAVANVVTLAREWADAVFGWGLHDDHDPVPHVDHVEQPAEPPLT